MSGNVTEILAPGQAQVRGMLEDVLEDAKEGKILSVGVVVFYRTDSGDPGVKVGWGGDALHPHEKLGMLEQAKFALLAQTCSDEDPDE